MSVSAAVSATITRKGKFGWPRMTAANWSLPYHKFHPPLLKINYFMPFFLPFKLQILKNPLLVRLYMVISKFTENF